MPINSFDNYPMTWKPSRHLLTSPFYKSLASLLETAIAEGILKPGDLLPPQRELADYLDLNLSTVSRAFKLCEQKGLIYGTIGKGTFIASDIEVNTTLLDPLQTQGLIEMGATHPPYTQNLLITQFIQTLLSKPHMASTLEYTSPCGTPSQKLAGQKWLKRLNFNVNADNILLANGGQNVLCAILTSLFKPGDRIGTDPLIYSGIKTLAQMLGIQLIPIPWVDFEMSCSALEMICKKENLKGIYVIPDYQNPTTHTMSQKTRLALARLASTYHLIIIEDAINTGFSSAPTLPIAHYSPEQTLYISSISKTLCSGLRLAFLYTPPLYKAALELALYNINIMTSPFIAEIVSQLINSSLLENIISQRQEEIRIRNQIANEILMGYDLLGDTDCNFRFLLLPKPWHGMAFETCAKNIGVQVYCSERFVIGSEPALPGIRIAISAPPTIDELKKGLLLIKSLLEQEDHFTMI